MEAPLICVFMNDYIVWVIAGLILGGFLWLKFRFFVSAQKVGALVKEGALVIDVRTESEYHSDPVEGAKNLPLSELPKGIGKLCPNKEQVILCHCLSGSRSAFGVAQLRKLGYRNSFNLGSVGRAHGLLSKKN